MSIRDLQAKMTEVGRIRTGWKDPDKTQASKLETFRITSPSEAYINLIAELYGGEPQPWQPQNGGPGQFEVFTSSSELPVLVPRQKIDPWMEQWGAGVCMRRCDGVEMITPKPAACLCKIEQTPKQRACKPTTRVNLELAEVPVLGWWRLDTHGWNAAARFHAIAEFVEVTPKPIPAILTLSRYTQMVADPDGGKPKTKDYMVPWLRIDGITAHQAAVGGDMLSQAIEAANGSRSVQQPTPAIAAGPSGPTAEFIDKALAAVERADSPAKIAELLDWVAERCDGDVPDRIMSAARSKELALGAQAAVEQAGRQAAALQLPAGPTDEDELDGLWMQVLSAAGAHGWSTSDVQGKILARVGGQKVSQVTVEQLRQVLPAVKAGQV